MMALVSSQTTLKCRTNPPDDNAIEEAVKIKEAGKATEISSSN